MAVLSVQQVPIDGGLADIAFQAADALGDEAPAGVCSAVVVKNDAAAAKIVTVTTPGTVSGLDIEDPATTVPAGGIGVISLVGRVFGSPVVWSYDDVTSVTVAAIQLAR